MPDDAQGTAGVCTPRRKKMRKTGNERRNEGERQGRRRPKGRKERSWWSEGDGTHGSSHHVVYQRHFILIFREGDGGKGLEWWRREKARDRETGERRRRSVQGGETRREGRREAERDGATGSSSLTTVANP